VDGKEMKKGKKKKRKSKERYYFCYEEITCENCKEDFLNQ
jgi:hypothetical protein